MSVSNPPAKFERDWKELWVDRMGLIVALSGERRFAELCKLKQEMAELPVGAQEDLKECLRQRFTPTDSHGGCQLATASVEEIVQRKAPGRRYSRGLIHH